MRGGVCVAPGYCPCGPGIPVGTTGTTAGLLYRESPHFVADADVGGCCRIIIFSRR